MFSQPYIFNDIFGLDPDALDMAILDERFEDWARRMDPNIVKQFIDSPWEKHNGRYTKKSQCSSYRIVALDDRIRMYFQK